MEIKPLVAIVILNYNGRHYLEKFLPSVLSSTYNNKKVIVGDNASTDDSVEWLKEYYPEVEILINQENFGFAKGYNEILNRVVANYFILLNSDVEVTPGWIEPVIELMESNETIGACQPKLLSYADKRKFEYAGASGGWLDQFGYPFSRGRVFDYCEDDNAQYDDIATVFWASGAALFIKANLFLKFKGFDEYFFAHQEEIDLCWRMQLGGYKIMVCPKSVVYHVGGGTLPKGEKKVYLNFRNNLMMLYKNWKAWELIWKLPFRIFLDAISAWKGLISGDRLFFKGVMKAHLSFFKWIFSGKKHNTFPNEKSGKVYGYYSGSVIFKHFIRNKKTFAEIVKKTQ